MNYGVTPQGFVLKTEDVILNELLLQAATEEYFGSEIDVSPHMPAGIMLRLMANSLANTWQGIESVYYQSFLETSEGVNLDRLADFGSVNRKSPQKEKVVLLFDGIDYTVIPIGFQVQTPSGVIYQTIESKTIVLGLADVQAEALEYGLVNRVAANQLTLIVTPMVGVDSVTNQIVSSGGSLRESDPELKERFSEIQGSRKNSGAVDYIQLQIRNLAFVNSCAVTENPRSVEYGDLPPNSMQFIVSGGTDLEVATAIATFKPAGIRTIGDILINVAIAPDVIIPIYFSRPSNIDVYATITITTNSEWTEANVQKIKTLVVQYIGGIDTYTANGETVSTEYKGLNVGMDVIALRLLLDYFNGIVGIEDLTATFSESESVVGTNKLVIASNRKAITSTDKVIVNVVNG